ncbi:hypothetical protein C8J57DRAFT_1223977 [Mycena rebaudengoi]|nr:hypothetical protein C8J57DRAFT_1223977 [Mycena rebaudengoi]
MHECLEAQTLGSPKPLGNLNVEVDVYIQAKFIKNLCQGGEDAPVKANRHRSVASGLMIGIAPTNAHSGLKIRVVKPLKAVANLQFLGARAVRRAREGTSVVSTGSERVQPSRSRTVVRLKNISTGREGYRDGRHGRATASNGDPIVCTKNSNNMGTKMNTSFAFQAQRVFEAAGRVNLVFDAL